MAISTFYGHNRSVSQVLDHLINKFRRRGHHVPSDDEHYELSDSDGNSETDRNASKNKLLGYSEDHAKDGESDIKDYRVSPSIANSSDRNNERGGEEAGVAVNSFLSRSFGIIDSISSDLPPVRTDHRDGMFVYLFLIKYQCYFETSSAVLKSAFLDLYFYDGVVGFVTVEFIKFACLKSDVCEHAVISLDYSGETEIF